MRTVQKCGLWVATGVLLSVTALAPSKQPNKLSPIPEGAPETVALVNEIAARFASVAVFDVNKDGRLDTAEQAAVAQAIAEGTLKLPKSGRSTVADQRRSANDSQTAKPAQIAVLLANFYASVAVYDVNKDGQLDSAEQAAVVRAITEGALKQQQPDAPAEDQPKKSEETPKSSDSAPVLARTVELLASGAAPDAHHHGHRNVFAAASPGCGGGAFVSAHGFRRGNTAPELDGTPSCLRATLARSAPSENKSSRWG